MHYLFAMLYWDNQDDSRYQNALIARKYLQEFSEYCGKCGLHTSVHLFDYSEKPKLAEPSVHSPYPAGDFKKTEKLNSLLSHVEKFDPDFIGIFDADMVIRPSDYEFLVVRMKGFSAEDYYVCEVDDVDNNTAIDYESGEVDESAIAFHSRSKGMIGDLGGLYFLPYVKTMELQPFDERFVVWGGEDNAASLTLQLQGLNPRNLFIRPLHLFHQSLENQALNTPQYQSQLDILAKLHGQLEPDGLFFAPAFSELKAVLSNESLTQDRSVYIEQHMNKRFQDVEESARRKILEYIFDNLLVDVFLKQSVSIGADLKLPLLLELITKSSLHQRVCRTLMQELQLGQGFSVKELCQIIAMRYGGQALAAQQTYAFLLWLQMLGILQSVDPDSSQMRWATRQVVSESQLVQVLEVIYQAEGKPNAIPVNYLLNAPVWKMLDLEKSVRSLPRSHSGTPALLELNNGECIVFKWDEMPDYHDE